MSPSVTSFCKCLVGGDGRAYRIAFVAPAYMEIQPCYISYSEISFTNTNYVLYSLKYFSTDLSGSTNVSVSWGHFRLLCWMRIFRTVTRLPYKTQLVSLRIFSEKYGRILIRSLVSREASWLPTSGWKIFLLSCWYKPTTHKEFQFHFYSFSDNE